MARKSKRTRTFWYWTADYTKPSGTLVTTRSSLYASEHEAHEALQRAHEHGMPCAYNETDGVMPYRNYRLCTMHA